MSTLVAKHDVFPGQSITIEKVEAGVFENVLPDGRKLTVPFHKGSETTLNGVTIESVLLTARAQLLDHQLGKYPSRENERAIEGIETSLKALDERKERLVLEAKAELEARVGAPVSDD